MAKHYEIVIFTASLNKYADPLLDLLDPKKVIRSRLFRESCVYYEGNYVKDLSLLNRDLSKTIIIDNSPSSYMFHPQNAIDCSSFVDDVRDRELDQISNFLAGIRNVPDVRRVVRRWREWPVLDIEEAAKEDTEDLQWSPRAKTLHWLGSVRLEIISRSVRVGGDSLGSKVSKDRVRRLARILVNFMFHRKLFSHALVEIILVQDLVSYIILFRLRRIAPSSARSENVMHENIR